MEFGGAGGHHSLEQQQHPYYQLNFTVQFVRMTLQESYRVEHQSLLQTAFRKVGLKADDQVVSYPTFSQVLIGHLQLLGIRYSFGVSGGAISPIWDALQQSSIETLHFRHETGAAFAACEAHFVDDNPVVVFTTKGPGLTNALTGLFAARQEGAKVILLTPYTSQSEDRRFSLQETTKTSMVQQGIYMPGQLFHYAVRVRQNSQLPQIIKNIAQGLSSPIGFVAHISIPTEIQKSQVSYKIARIYNPNLAFQTSRDMMPNTESEQKYKESCMGSKIQRCRNIRRCQKLLTEKTFVIWIGFGARRAASQIQDLAERYQARVMCTPRGKGIFPEQHELFIGVTGELGCDRASQYMKQNKPQVVFVLGTRLSQISSSWNQNLAPQEFFIHVDLDPKVPGQAYRQPKTIGINADIGQVASYLLEFLPFKKELKTQPEKRDRQIPISSSIEGLVNPYDLMKSIQKVIVDGTNALVMAEPGNAMIWGSQLLRFDTPKRFRTSVWFASMGHFSSGILGAALAIQSQNVADKNDDCSSTNGSSQGDLILAHNRNKVVAIVGDGAMLMNNEINTAVNYNIPAIWIVLNDGCYNMIEQGCKSNGYNNQDTFIPQVDFVAFAKSMGADGVFINSSSDIDEAIIKGMKSTGPFIIDVRIDPSVTAPRNRSYVSQKHSIK
eukprot:TRINITY_DN1218_c0_g1_i2.p1 TRINITY_DN1218_c0_g1~~TRINITY_DN1218_c0_g1_i2.p1  ORF type:complete len:667 (-),score=30.66 TRINITY_DN1218_c0_g1_i2:732-2732(-)